MAALVEQRGEQGQAEQHQHRQRVRHHVLGGRGDLAAAEQPRIRRDQAGQHHDHDERAEQRPEQAREELHARLGDQGAAQLQREQALSSAGRPRIPPGRLGALEQAERSELVGHQVLDVADADRPAEDGGHLLGDLGDRAAAVDPAQHQVQQPGQLHDLAAGMAGQVGGHSQARPLVLAERLDPRGQPRHQGTGGVGGFRDRTPSSIWHGTPSPGSGWFLELRLAGTARNAVPARVRRGLGDGDAAAPRRCCDRRSCPRC